MLAILTVALGLMWVWSEYRFARLRTKYLKMELELAVYKMIRWGITKE